jgi:PAS domain S-box-containing protein
MPELEGNVKKEAYSQLRNKKIKYYIKSLKGPCLALLLVAAMNIFSLVEIDIIAIISIFSIIVVYAGIAEGLFSSVLTALISALYYIQYALKNITYFGDNNYILNHAIINSFILFGVAFVIGAWYRNMKKKFDELKKEHERLERAEEDLKKSHMFNQSVIDSLPFYITVLNSEGKIIAANNKESFPCSRCLFNMAVGSDYISAFKNSCEKCTNSFGLGVKGIEAILKGKESSFDIEYKCNALYQSKWFMMSVTRLANGGAVISHIDITKRKQAEDELVQSSEQYRKLIEFLPEAAIVHCNGEIVFANATSLRIFGVKSSKELIGQNIFKYIDSSCYDIVKKRVEEVQLQRKDIPYVEEKIVRSDGKVIDVEVGATFFPYKGRPASLVVIRDITEKRQAEKLRKEMEEKEKLLDEAREYDKVKTDFFANISHELRTPLNVILGTLQLLELHLRNNLIEDRENKLCKYHKIMKQNCFRLLRLVNNLIDITKIDSGFFEIHPKNLDIVSLVEDITLSVAEYVENKSIELIFDTEVEEKIIACDPDKIERIVLNLLSNAIKFTKPMGSIMVNLYDKGDKVAISVKDTGIGISEDKLNIIFERFRQVNKSLTRDHEGSGIGLSLVKSLVEMHGGTVSIKSEYGKGSEFIVELPVVVLPYTEDDEVVANEDHIERINIEFSDIYS